MEVLAESNLMMGLFHPPLEANISTFFKMNLIQKMVMHAQDQHTFIFGVQV